MVAAVICACAKASTHGVQLVGRSNIKIMFYLLPSTSFQVKAVSDNRAKADLVTG